MTSNKVKNTTNKVVKSLTIPGLFLSGVFTIIMILSILREVIGRYFFNNPSDWSLELCSYLLVGMVYLGAADTELEDKNVRIDFIYLRYQEKGRYIVNFISALFGSIWCLILFWQGGLLTWHSFISGDRSSSVLRWPLFPAQTAMELGLAILLIILFYKLYLSFIKLLALKMGK